MNQFTHHLQHTVIGDPVASANMAMFPLLRGGDDTKPADYLCFEEALEKKQVSVTEVSEEGSVPTLLLDNRAGQPVFLLDGELLVGAKQNRTVNLSLLIAAGARTEIPVSCVEAGRWSRSRARRRFRNSRYMHFARGRRDRMAQVNNSLRRRKSRRADQRQVWDSIAEKRRAFAAKAPTGAMDDIYAHASPRLDDYASGLQPSPGQVGAVFAIDGEVRGFDLFADAGSCAKYLPKLVGSYALDALETADAGKQQKLARQQVRDFLARFGTASEEVHEAVGLGEDLRAETDEVVGAGLVWEDKCIHLAGFTKDAQVAEADYAEVD